MVFKGFILNLAVESNEIQQSEAQEKIILMYVICTYLFASLAMAVMNHRGSHVWLFLR